MPSDPPIWGISALCWTLWQKEEEKENNKEPACLTLSVVPHLLRSTWVVLSVTGKTTPVGAVRCSDVVRIAPLPPSDLAHVCVFDSAVISKPG